MGILSKIIFGDNSKTFVDSKVSEDELKRQQDEVGFTDEELDAYGLTDEKKRLVKEEGWSPWDFNDDEDEEPEDDDYYGEDEPYEEDEEDDEEEYM